MENIHFEGGSLYCAKSYATITNESGTHFAGREVVLVINQYGKETEIQLSANQARKLARTLNVIASEIDGK